MWVERDLNEEVKSWGIADDNNGYPTAGILWDHCKVPFWGKAFHGPSKYLTCKEMKSSSGSGI